MDLHAALEAIDSETFVAPRGYITNSDDTVFTKLVRTAFYSWIINILSKYLLFFVLFLDVFTQIFVYHRI
jgi:hypothetical protein